MLVVGGAAVTPEIARELRATYADGELDLAVARLRGCRDAELVRGGLQAAQRPSLRRTWARGRCGKPPTTATTRLRTRWPRQRENRSRARSSFASS